MWPPGEAMDYKTIAWAPGQQYFDCDRMHATLSTTACANNWRRSQDRDGGLWQCRGCRVGAGHAGEREANLWFGRGELICARCHRGTVRLVRGELCVSCYNRERESILGVNARGVFPTKMPALRERTLFFVQGLAARQVTKPRSLDMTELLVAQLRDARESVTFAFRAPPAAFDRGAQLALF